MGLDLAGIGGFVRRWVFWAMGSEVGDEVRLVCCLGMDGFG